VPWAGLDKIMSSNLSFDAGDTILLRNGDHNIVKINLENDDFVYIMPETGQQPAIKQLDFGSVATTAYWQMEGLTIESENNGARIFLITATDKATHINIVNCKIQSAAETEDWTREQWRERTHHGLLTLGGGCLIQGCTIKNVSLGMSIEGGTTDVIGNVVENFTIDGIRMLSSDCLFEKNMVFNNIIVHTNAENHNDGFQSFTCCPVGSDTIRNVIVRQNYILNTTDEDRKWYGPMQGLVAFDGYFKNWTIENNIVVTDHWHGITFLGAVNCSIVNNTVIDPYDESATSFNNPDGINLGPTWVKIGPHKDGRPSLGNIIRNNLTADLQTQGSGAVVDHNIKIGPSVRYKDYFLDVDALDLRLKPESVAVDAGSPEMAPLVDFDDNPRPLGNAFDIGAWEYDVLNATKDIKISHVQVFPNPTSDFITLQAENINPESLSIYSTDGQLVMIKSKGDLTKMDVKDLPSGAYILFIKTKGEMQRAIFIKNN
jgi:hypothetical protein